MQENTFGFKDCPSLITFLAALVPYRRSMIRKIEYTAHYWPDYRPSNSFQSAAALLSHCSSFQSLSIIVLCDSWYIRHSNQLPQHEYYLHLRSDENDWRRLRTTSVLHFQVSIWTSCCTEPPKLLLSGLGVSADHGNIKFSGEDGFVGTNATLVGEVRQLNTRILELGTHCSQKYAIDKPVTGSRLQEALIHSNLDVYGDDRIGQSDTSGIVSRGTRSRTLRARQVSSNGVLPRVGRNSKYLC
ncbi:hypothetical protein LX36DRAFT_461259 [Colletotrichum falcatum]|nr:hypothetical protein LX36DRAFT_461259 [Colletotrichum falcatum]